MKVYLLEQKIFHYKDETDGENVEDVYIMGYFSSKQKVVEAKEKCAKHHNEEELFITEYEVKNQTKYVYVLFYEYSIFLNSDGEYVEYYYDFGPYSSKEECEIRKNELLKDIFYQPNETKVFDEESDRGFIIQKIEIDTFYSGI